MTALANAQARTPIRRQPAPVTTTADANELAAHYIEVMDALVDVIQQETELVRAGRLARRHRPRADQDRARAALYCRHAAAARQPGAAREHFSRRRCPSVIRHHNTFRALLQINLTVLATAHAVSEGIVRGVSGELTRKSAPQTYGASGRANAPNPRAATAARGQPRALKRRPPFSTVVKIVERPRPTAAVSIHFTISGCARDRADPGSPFRFRCSRFCRFHADFYG